MRNLSRFLKDRHYLDKEWGHHFSGEGRRVILEMHKDFTEDRVNAFVCDLTIDDLSLQVAPSSVDIVTMMHKDFTEDRVNAFVCDLTIDDLSLQVAPSSVDIVTMIFVLSAVSPEKMPAVVQNIRNILKPGGRILFRDYATGDLAQERFTGKEQKISENFYVRGDGTRAFYFSDEFLRNLFEENGFVMEEHVLCCKQVENRSREIVMNRRWIQAVFRAANDNTISGAMSESDDVNSEKMRKADVMNGFEIDMSEGMGVEMDYNFKIKLLSKEHQHTCPSTGLMLWESARLMASILATNQEIVSGKRVLELGCGCGGICSMIAATSADLVVATDGDPKALDLLAENVASNLEPPFLDCLTVKRLEWGNKNDIEAVKRVNERGFDIIIGTDVTYVSEAVVPLFATAKELISRSGNEIVGPGLILCHVLRRVDEPSILSAAGKYGFRLVDRWPDRTSECSSGGVIIKKWFSYQCQYEVPSTALNIMYFQFG
ncbi:methyltransferase-like protein 6 [Phtheirospermum japonicum]|uniref:Methyltransferase-like protein 6 n=1 Tax=Phtheirospermum japonicum TaxID=374723 RepID=A0A830D5Y1_9LAMI|nr:methyltransferase-like protein 6 [Phtheirospermum japonicum]